MNQDNSLNGRLLAIIEKSGLDEARVKAIQEGMAPHMKYVNAALKAIEELETRVTPGIEVSQDIIDEASEARKLVKKKRTEIESKRKELKEPALREGQLIDAIAAEYKLPIEAIELRASRIEKHNVNIQEARRAELQSTRLELLAACQIPVSLINSSALAGMTEDEFSEYMADLSVQAEELEQRQKSEREKYQAMVKQAEEQAAFAKAQEERARQEAIKAQQEMAMQKAQADAERRANEILSKKNAAAMADSNDVEAVETILVLLRQVIESVPAIETAKSDMGRNAFGYIKSELVKVYTTAGNALDKYKKS